MKETNRKTGMYIGTACLCLVLLAGCGLNKTSGESGALAGNTENSGEASAAAPQEETSLQKEASQQEEAALSLYEGTDYSWQEITVRIPEAWKNKYILEESENGFYFLQKASNEKTEGMGYLCGFYRYEGPVYEYAGERQLAFTKEKMYYMQVPTDVSFYYEDQQIADEYAGMAEYITAMAEGMRVDAPEVQYNPEEYQLPMSDTCVIEETALLNLNDNELRIARNELFARYGQLFKDVYLQEHFNACSWYQGTVPAGTLSEDVFNTVEKENLSRILAAEKAYQTEHPYPSRQTIGEKILADLDGDGTVEELLCRVSQENGETAAAIQINQTVYNLADFQVYMENPETEDFYLTDISPYFDGLEIALLEYGPSSDPATHFFSYDGELHFLGTVGGFPFKDRAYLNGFCNQGSVTGTIRTDLIHTCYSYANWWYDYEKKQLVLQDVGYYRMLPDGAHELFIPLTVYTEMNTSSVQKIIPAQNEVYFTATDGKEWLQLKAKDGSQGYIHVTDGKIDGAAQENDEVFSGLEFAD